MPWDSCARLIQYTIRRIGCAEVEMSAAISTLTCALTNASQGSNAADSQDTGTGASNMLGVLPARGLIAIGACRFLLPQPDASARAAEAGSNVRLLNHDASNHALCSKLRPCAASDQQTKASYQNGAYIAVPVLDCDASRFIATHGPFAKIRTRYPSFTYHVLDAQTDLNDKSGTELDGRLITAIYGVNNMLSNRTGSAPLRDDETFTLAVGGYSLTFFEILAASVVSSQHTCTYAFEKYSLMVSCPGSKQYIFGFWPITNLCCVVPRSLHGFPFAFTFRLRAQARHLLLLFPPFEMRVWREELDELRINRPDLTSRTCVTDATPAPAVAAPAASKFPE
eukprot:1296052-Pleurochrysis_carterae.AAC.2